MFTGDRTHAASRVAITGNVFNWFGTILASAGGVSAVGGQRERRGRRRKEEERGLRARAPEATARPPLACTQDDAAARAVCDASRFTSPLAATLRSATTTSPTARAGASMSAPTATALRSMSPLLTTASATWLRWEMTGRAFAVRLAEAHGDTTPEVAGRAADARRHVTGDAGLRRD